MQQLGVEKDNIKVKEGKTRMIKGRVSKDTRES